MNLAFNWKSFLLAAKHFETFEKYVSVKLFVNVLTFELKDSVECENPTPPWIVIVWTPEARVSQVQDSRWVSQKL